MSTKLSSRKFAVWLTWLIITILVIISSVIMTVVTKEESLTEIVLLCLKSFFAISMMYLGMNVSQKAAFALSDALKKEKSNEIDGDIE